ncbi:hypothetical protein CDD83_4230 [Cordyceps sp. RAO-2017]|nr:hypothetical protein CDD83_4230 [Cordyceps sp. RAO-2017]
MDEARETQDRGYPRIDRRRPRAVPCHERRRSECSALTKPRPSPVPNPLHLSGEPTWPAIGRARRRRLSRSADLHRMRRHFSSRGTAGDEGGRTGLEQGSLSSSLATELLSVWQMGSCRSARWLVAPPPFSRRQCPSNGCELRMYIQPVGSGGAPVPSRSRRRASRAAGRWGRRSGARRRHSGCGRAQAGGEPASASSGSAAAVVPGPGSGGPTTGQSYVCR